MAPTRELAQQIQSVAHEFGRLLGINSLCVFGGASKVTQARELMRRSEFVSLGRCLSRSVSTFRILHVFSIVF